MRSSLCENNKTMWEMLEERRQLQSSVAHDLRNPIAIIQGYIEYLQIHLTDGMLSQERIEQILQNLAFAASRLEHYTESLKTLNQLEDLTLEKKSIAATILVEKLISDCRAMLVQSNLNLSIKSDVPSSTVYVDSSALCRILENVIDNAMRFAAHEITLSFTVTGDAMTITVADDGPGFSQRVLEDQYHHPLPKVQNDGHMGMGLTVGRLLSQKHGGHLTLSNGDHGGAIVKMILKI